MTSPRKNGVVSSFPKTGAPCRRARGEFWAIATSLVRVLFVTVLTGFSDAVTRLTVKMLISAFSLSEAVLAGRVNRAVPGNVINPHFRYRW